VARRLQLRWRFGGFLGAVVFLALAAAGTTFAFTRGGGQATPEAPPSVREVTAAASPTPEPTPTATPTPEPRYPSLIDGVELTEAEFRQLAARFPIGVMVDNSALAVPQYGLSRAELVVEAFVEGGITRYLAFFWRNDASRIEPVRSARTPFLYWVLEFDALYAHAGSAATGTVANAEQQVREWGIRDLDGLLPPASSAFYRDPTRVAPYNLTTSTAALRDAAARLGLSSGFPTVEVWPFKADFEETANAPLAGAIELSYRSAPVPWDLRQWQWDPATNTYLRFYRGGPDIDLLTGEQLRFKNVIVMYVPAYVADDRGHVLLEQFGEGRAQVFLDGRVVEGTWRKADRASRTRFYDRAGNEIRLNRGPIFIQMVAPDSFVRVYWRVPDLPPLPPYQPPAVAPDPATEPEEPTPTPPAETPTATPTLEPSPTATATPEPSPTVSPTPESTPTPPEPPASPTAAGG
jgi:hypothetical protein